MKRKKMKQLPLWNEDSRPVRGVAIHVRLTEEEHAHVVARAKLAKMLVSQFVRACLAKPGQP